MALRLGTVFSGIGAPEEALKKMGVDFITAFACDNGERTLKQTRKEIQSMLESVSQEEHIDFIKQLYIKSCGENKVEKTYMDNHAKHTKQFVQDIRFFSPQSPLDMLVGGSPCQSFSAAGYRRGFQEERGQLFFDYIRVIKSAKPSVFVFENVPNIEKHDNGKTWEIISQEFNDLDYTWEKSILNAKDYGLPQNRKRLFVVAFRSDLAKYAKQFAWPSKKKLQTTTKDFLLHPKEVPNKYYLPIKGFLRCINPKNNKYLVVNSTVSRTQVANQQYNWYGDMRFETDLSEKVLGDDRIHKGNYKDTFGAMRTLTPHECLRLMGFSNSFKLAVGGKVAYRQSGNSIAVPVLENIFESIFETGVFL